MQVTHGGWRTPTAFQRIDSRSQRSTRKTQGITTASCLGDSSASSVHRTLLNDFDLGSQFLVLEGIIKHVFWPLSLRKTRHMNQLSFKTIRGNHMKLLIINCFLPTKILNFIWFNLNVWTTISGAGEVAARLTNEETRLVSV